MTNNSTEMSQMDTIATPFPLAAGEVYAGLSRDPDTGAWHHLVLLPATTDKCLTWGEAIEWAKSVGGDLPTRNESALLYANARDQIIEQNYWYYWASTPRAFEPSRAWFQNFGNGHQIDDLKGYLCKARAVRRVLVK